MIYRGVPVNDRAKASTTILISKRLKDHIRKIKWDIRQEEYIGKETLKYEMN